MTYTTRETCRVCGSKDLTTVIDLGEQYVSDFVDKDRIYSGHKCPIELQLCGDCTLVQAKHSPPQDFLYTRHYWYRSGINPAMREALRDITREIEERVDLSWGDVVLDIGSNDGTLLRSYTKDGLVTVGVEPATNLAVEGSEGVDVFINEFWSSRCCNGPKAKVITAIGMFYDLEDPNQFIADVAGKLHPEGVFVAQLMCLKNMLNMNDIGNLAHEHLEFYSLKSLVRLFANHGLEIFDIETNNVNGESYRLWVCHTDAWDKFKPKGLNHRLYEALLSQDDGLDDPQLYKDFQFEMHANRNDLHRFIRSNVGKRFWVYGASTKGNVVLQYLGINHNTIEAAADKSPEKWGKYTIRTGIPIKSEEEFRKANPDYAIILPYTFASEFVKREADWLAGGGKFIVPLPEFKVL